MSTLNVDALVGNTSANAITVRGEGSATTSLQQGLLKAWIHFGGSAAIRDSFNHSSVTDNGTGDFSPVITNAFSNVDYSQTFAVSRQTDCSVHNINTNNSSGNDVSPTTTVYRLGALKPGTGGVDVTYLNTQIAGDLA
jgi:hypothetical protein